MMAYSSSRSRIARVFINDVIKKYVFSITLRALDLLVPTLENTRIYSRISTYGGGLIWDFPYH